MGSRGAWPACSAAARRCLAKNSTSASHTRPVISVARVRIASKSKCIVGAFYFSPVTARSLLAHVEHRQEGLLGNLHGADLLHALLAFLLLLQQLALARDVAAVA